MRRPLVHAALAAEIAWYVVVLAGVLFGGLAGYGRGDRVEFVLLVVLATACAATALTRWWRPGWTAPAAAAVLAVGVVVLLVRPLGPLGPLRQMLSLAVGPVLVAATVRRSAARTSVLVVLLAVAAAAVDTGLGGFTLSTDLVRLLTGRAPRSAAQILPVAAFVALVPVAVGLTLRSADAARHAAALARVRLEERLEVARELHDMVANHVTGMILAAQAGGLPDGIPAPTSTALHSVETAGDRALGAMRRMVATLRSGDLADRPPDPGPGEETVERTALAAVRVAVGDDPSVRVEHTGADPDADPEIVRTVHRLVREGLTNARRHMPAGSAVDVELSTEPSGSVVLQITNRRGRAPRRTRGGGFGLVGLAERVDAVGGRVESGPLDDRHWRLRAELPGRDPSP